MRSLIRSLALIAALATTVACATSGASRFDPASQRGDKIMFVSQYYSGYEARHIGNVIRTFEKHGFTPTRDRSGAAYQLDFSIRAGISATVEIALLQHGKTVIEVSSTNYGWGTMIARPVAIARRVDAAVERLDELLESGD